ERRCRRGTSPRRSDGRAGSHAHHGGMSATVPTKFRGRARRDAAAFYLSQIARGVLAGELTLDCGEHSTVVATSEFLMLEIEVKQKKRGNSIAVKLRWPRRPLITIATDRAKGSVP
ncbi:MAG: amphi-Trp domain-containing protein, partial [Candidatus Rokuibacteriota bacterium]